MGRKGVALFFIILIFHIGLVLPKAKFKFSPHMFPPEEFWLCYNSPDLVAQRGGFLVASGCLKRIESSSKKMSTTIKRGCFSGSPVFDLDLPWVKYPFLLGNNLFIPPSLEVSQFFSLPSVLFSQVYLTPPEHPS